MSRLVLAGAVMALAASTLTGCGAASPGVAAHVGDDTVTASRADDLSVSYCKALTPALKAGNGLFPMGFVRAYVVRNLTLQAAAEQLAHAYAVKLPASYAESLRDLRTQLETSYDPDYINQAVEVDEVQVYLPAVETAVGGILLAQAGETGADDDAKLARGADAMQEWLSEHPADVNPRYGISVSSTDLGPPRFTDTSTSFPLSKRAIDAEKISSQEGPDSTYLSTLPSSQLCG